MVSSENMRTDGTPEYGLCATTQAKMVHGTCCGRPTATSARERFAALPVRGLVLLGSQRLCTLNQSDRHCFRRSRTRPTRVEARIAAARKAHTGIPRHSAPGYYCESVFRRPAVRGPVDTIGGSVGVGRASRAARMATRQDGQGLRPPR